MTVSLKQAIGLEKSGREDAGTIHGKTHLGRFGGDALTYYGRWTYKREEATRRGAKASFLIHTDSSAGNDDSICRCDTILAQLSSYLLCLYPC